MRCFFKLETVSWNHDRNVEQVLRYTHIKKLCIDLIDDLQVAWKKLLKQLNWPTFQRLRQHRVIGVCKCAAHCLPRLQHTTHYNIIICCRRTWTTRPPNGEPWRYHRATDKSEVRWQSIQWAQTRYSWITSPTPYLLSHCATTVWYNII